MSLELAQVSKSFGTVPVLDAVSIELPRGARLAIVGASGSGKSTLLRIIAGFEHPDSGRVVLDGRVLDGPGVAVPAHRRGIGYVAQDGALFPHLTVEGNVAFGLDRRRDRARRVREVMELTSLDPALARRFPHQLSGGQQQRVALARALVLEPSVILLDESFSALDTGLRAHTRAAMVAALERSGVTTVLVTHDQDEALTFGHQIGIIAGGRLVQSGDPAEVYDAPADAEVAAFLGDVVEVPANVVASGLVNCAFGTIAVRHDRSTGGSAVRAMVRPAQLRIEPADGSSNATVVDVSTVGSSTHVRLRVGAGSESIEVTHRLPPHRASEFAPGSAVSVVIEGGVVLYPAHSTTSATSTTPPTSAGSVNSTTQRPRPASATQPPSADVDESAAAPRG